MMQCTITIMMQRTFVDLSITFINILRVPLLIDLDAVYDNDNEP